MVPATRPTSRVNTRACPVCGAKRGERCFILTGTRFVELKDTHTENSALQGEVFVTTAPATPEDIAARRRSTPELDARYAQRKRREAESRRKLNGG